MPLSVPARYTLHFAAVRDTYEHRPISGNVFRKRGQVSSDSRPGARRDPPGLWQNICKPRVDHDHSARGPPGT